MNLKFTKKKYYAYCGGPQNTVLSEVYRPKTKPADIRILGLDNCPAEDPETADRFLRQASPQPGSISMALPLQLFEIVTIQLPQMPDEAVAKALPFHLAKQVPNPLGEYLYDWQITKRKKNHLLITVYLFPRKIYQPLADRFSKDKLQLTYFEPDIFAAFAFLGANGELEDDQAALLTIIWPNGLSFAVLDENTITLARYKDLPQPAATEATDDAGDIFSEEDENETPTDTPENKPEETEVDFAFELESAEDEEAAGYNQGDSLLAGFDILAENNTMPADHGTPTTPVNNLDEVVLELEDSASTDTGFKSAEPTVPLKTRDYWDEYVANIDLEILRTRDYYTNFIKGRPIKRYYVLGAGDFFKDLSGYLKQSLGEEPQKVRPANHTGECANLLAVLAIGTGARW